MPVVTHSRIQAGDDWQIKSIASGVRQWRAARRRAAKFRRLWFHFHLSRDENRAVWTEMIAASPGGVSIFRRFRRSKPLAGAIMKYLLSVLLFAVSVALGAVPPAEKLLPPGTLAYFTVPNAAQGRSNFSNSALGQIGRASCRERV